jgi:hypothetical protein
MQQTLDEKIALILAKHDPIDIAVDHEDRIAYDPEARDIETQWYDYDDKIELIEDVFIFWFNEVIDSAVTNQIIEDIKPLFT